jgi:hypothetical protein
MAKYTITGDRILNIPFMLSSFWQDSMQLFHRFMDKFRIFTDIGLGKSNKGGSNILTYIAKKLQADGIVSLYRLLYTGEMAWDDVKICDLYVRENNLMDRTIKIIIP